MGGYKVVYEYANHLSRRGYQISFIHPATVYFDRPLKDQLKALRYVPLRISKGYRPDRWFKVDSKVKLLWAPSLHERHIPDADIIVATAWQTAEWIITYGRKKGKKVYFVHDYEHYMAADNALKERIRRTFHCGLSIISTSPAGMAMVEESGGRITADIPNGVDFSIYRKSKKIEDPNRNMIGFPARNETFKGTHDAIQALASVKDCFPEIKVWAYGPKRVKGLPEWVRFYLRPSDRELSEMYNCTSIFVTASHYEGWGLPGAEAMACGAALVSTDHGGVRAYASNDETALLSPIKRPDALAENILALIRDNGRRIHLAQAGYEHIQQFTWDRAVNRFAAVIHEL
ncbi:MAG TPA: glycosyltransferase family 4 protein [Terriglobia bacterium]|nr:glycosyltransferase family 4 protein [Terriglobia bacterium]